MTGTASSLWPRRDCALFALGFAVTAAAFHLWPHDPTAPLRGIAGDTDPFASFPEWRAAKAPGETRILLVGGSLTQGYPYGAQASYARVLEEALRVLFPERRIGVRTLATAAVASGSLAAMVDAGLAAAPDCVWVDVGNNELGARLFYGSELTPSGWLGHIGDHGTRSRLLFATLRTESQPTTGNGLDRQLDALVGRLLQAAPGKPLVDALPPSEGDRAAIAARLRHNLAHIVAATKQQGVPVAFLLSPYDLAGAWPRGMSEHQPEIDRAVLAYHRGERAPKDTVAALAQRFPTRADVQFLSGRRLLELGELDAARAALLRARDLDPAPLHMVAEVEAAVRQTAAAHGVAALQPELALTLGASAIPDPDAYLDPSHWNLRGIAAGAAWLAEQLAAHGHLPPLPADWRSRFAAVAEAYLDRAVDAATRARCRADMQRATGVYHLMFGNPRDALLPLTDGVAWFANQLDGPQATVWFDWSTRVLWCAAAVAERQDQLLAGTPQQRDRRVLGLAAALFRAARSQAAREFVLQIVDGESFDKLAGQ